MLMISRNDENKRTSHISAAGVASHISIVASNSLGILPVPLCAHVSYISTSICYHLHIKELHANNRPIDSNKHIVDFLLPGPMGRSVDI